MTQLLYVSRAWVAACLLVSANSIVLAAENHNLVQRAEALLASGRDAESLDALGGFVEELRGKASGERALLPKALAVAESLEQRQPGLFQAVYTHAEILYVSARYTDALRVLGRIEAKDRSADYFNLAGMSYAGLGDLAVASRAVLRAIELAPDRPDLLVNLAGLYQLAGDNQSALRALTKAVSMPGAAPEAFFALALTHYNLGNFARAVEYCVQTTTRNSTFDRAYLLMGRAYNRMSNLSAAVTAFRQAAALHPSCDDCWFELAQLSESPAESERLLRKVLAINPRHARGYYRLGKFLRERKQNDEAIDALRRAIALDPDMDGAYYQLGALYRQQGEPDRARELLAKLRALKEQRRAATQSALTRSQQESAGPAARVDHQPK